MRRAVYSQHVALGSGAFGKAYRVRHANLDAHVVLKRIPVKRNADELMEEARLLAKRNLKRAPKVLDVFREKGHVCLIMEWVKGLSLKALRNSCPLSFEEALDICGKLLTALDECHQQGICHGDISPANIMCDIYGNLMLIDFGLSSAAVEKSGRKTGGTPAYTAPEVLNGERRNDFLSDQYSAGAVLLELLYNIPAQQAGQINNTLPGGKKADYPVFTSPLQRKLWPVVMRCLETKPEGRWPSAAQLQAEFYKMAGTTSNGWRESVTTAYKSDFSRKLSEAAERHLNGSRARTAYALLREAVSLSPENAKAMSLLRESDFTGHNKTIPAAAIVILIVTASLFSVFFLFREGRTPSLPLPENRSGRIAAPEGVQPPASTTGVNLLRKSEGRNLSGKLILKGFGHDKLVVLNGDTVGTAEPLSLKPGQYHVGVIMGGRLHREKRVTLQAFQSLTVQYEDLDETE